MSDSSSPSSSPAQLKLGLLLLRLGVAAVMIPWSIDKIINPEHTARVFENFYFVGGLDASVSAVLASGSLLLSPRFYWGSLRNGLMARFC
ncbi:MAG: hypothetical protein ACKVG0_09000 [Alphaproteobacteria bacterium]